MKTQNILGEIIAKSGLSKARFKRKYAYDLIAFENNLKMLEIVKGSKQMLWGYARAEFRNSRMTSDKIKRLMREHCAKLYFRAYKAA